MNTKLLVVTLLLCSLPISLSAQDASSTNGDSQKETAPAAELRTTSVDPRGNENAQGKAERRTVHGKWTAEFDTVRGRQKYVFSFERMGSTIAASATAELDGVSREIQFQDVELKEDAIAFVEVLEAQGGELRIQYSGKIAGDEIHFHRAVGDFGSTDSVATRVVPGEATSEQTSAITPVPSKSSEPVSSPQDGVPDPKFLIFLCFGQSNMEGGARMEEIDQVGNKRFQVMADFDNPSREWKKGNWYEAVPPLTRRIRGLTLVDYFGKTMIANLPDDYRVGVIKVAVPGAKIEMFDKDKCAEYLVTAEAWKKNIAKEYGDSPYQYLVELAKSAQKDGVIQGILLHQGESNTNDQEWPNKVKKIYSDFMQDLNLDPAKVPLLAGEVVHADQNGATASVNEIMKRLPDTLPNSFVISSSGIPCNPDRLHFTSAGLRELGRRYAVRMLTVMGYEAKEPKTSYLEQDPGAQNNVPPQAEKSKVALKDVFKEDFLIGVAVNRSVTTGQAFRRSAEDVASDVALVKQQFNQIVAENEMKWQLIHPRAGADGYDFAAGDALVEFAQSHQMQLAGHTLVWHSQTPNWVFEGTAKAPEEPTAYVGYEALTVAPPRMPPNGFPGPPPAPPNAPAPNDAAANPSASGNNTPPPNRPRSGRIGPGGFGGFQRFDLNGPRATREELLERMRQHIHAVVGRYKGKVKVWDVVNEALSDNGSEVLRHSPWSVIIGPDFIAKAFEYAHEADPEAILRYNDYGLENPEKRKKLIVLIKALQARRVPVMAIGSQADCNVNTTFETMDQALTEMEELGLPIHITELDVNTASRGQQGTGADIAANGNTTQGGQVADSEKRLAETYAGLFRAFKKHSQSVEIVTFWGVNDAVSWRSQGKPLLFDGSNVPKPAFDAVIQVGSKDSKGSAGDQDDN